MARSSEEELARLLEENADEPYAELIAGLLKQHALETTHAADRVLRSGLIAALPRLAKADVKMSIRRTFQALRIAVNGEFTALDALLRSLPHCLAPGGRVAMLTFHSGEDRRVKKAFQARLSCGHLLRRGDEVIRSAKEETFANRRASAAKLRWAVRARGCLLMRRGRQPERLRLRILVRMKRALILRKLMITMASTRPNNSAPTLIAPVRPNASTITSPRPATSFVSTIFTMMGVLGACIHLLYTA